MTLFRGKSTAGHFTAHAESVLKRKMRRDVGEKIRTSHKERLEVRSAEFERSSF
jgi:hypothetical protein